MYHIAKSHPKSIIRRMHVTSTLVESVFNKQPKHDDKDVVVLQVSAFGKDNAELLVELVTKTDMMKD